MEIYGYASVFHVVDAQKEVVEKGAFLESLMELKRGRMIPLLLEHGSTVGWVEWGREDEHGLWIKGRLDQGQPLRNIGLSIGFQVVSSTFKGGVKHLQKINLREVSLVKRPANMLATFHNGSFERLMA